MIKSILMLCARGIVVDQHTNNVSVFNLLEELSPEGLPTFVPELVMFSLLERQDDIPETVDLTLKISIGDQSVLETAVSTNFKGKRRSRNIITIGALLLQQPGILRFELSYDNESLDEYQIAINPPRLKARVVEPTEPPADEDNE